MKMVITLHTYQLVLPCLLGVEGLVAEELRDMGAENVAPENGRVLCAGSPEMIARANIRSRFAERVLVLPRTFAAKSFQSLFRGVKALPWTEWIGRDDAFPVKGRCLSSQLMSVPDCQAIIKKAVVESLKEAYKLEHFPETGANYQLQFLIMKDKVSLMLDTSGPGLHKRGYRRKAMADLLFPDATKRCFQDVSGDLHLFFDRPFLPQDFCPAGIRQLQIYYIPSHQRHRITNLLIQFLRLGVGKHTDSLLIIESQGVLQAACRLT